MELQTTKRDEMELTFAYADDIGLVTNQPAQLQVAMDVWTKALTDNGLKLNVKKSEVMAVGRKPETLHITANGSELKHVESFRYLGVTFDSTASKETTINERICHYSKNVGMLYPLLKDKYVLERSKSSSLLPYCDRS